jgi:hypothetical protein
MVDGAVLINLSVIRMLQAQLENGGAEFWLVV